MQQQAVKMIVAMLLTGIVISVASRNLVPLLVMPAVGYVIWHVAKGLNGG